MSKKEKLRQRLLVKPKDLRFEELVKIITSYGYVLKNIKGTHHVFQKPGYCTLTIPCKSPVKSYLIKEVLDAIGDLLEQDDE